MIYMLFDNPEDKNNMKFLYNYETADIQQVYPPYKCNSVKDMLNVCNDMIKQSTHDDTIICWYDFMAVLCWWLCKLKLKKRKVVALNILLKDKDTLKNKLAKFLYRKMLKSNNVQATVTSKNYGEHLNQILKINKKYTLLHDIYHGNYNIGYSGITIPNTVFCGGRNGRDWNFLIKIAKSMPEVVFNCVMPKNIYKQYENQFSTNMKVLSDVPEKRFLEFMCESQLVVMPLDTEAPAGLIAFYQATANGKMSITSDTVSTQEYFTDGRGALCINDIDDWKNNIQYYLEHNEVCDMKVERLKNFLENDCSEEKYAKTLWEIVM